MLANMKSCHTRIPSSSQRSWKSLVSYAIVPPMRIMFTPASRNCSRADSIGSPVRREAGEIERRPADAAAEYRLTVDDEAEAVAIGAAIHVNRAEADASEIDGLCNGCGAEARMVARTS